MKKQIDKQSAEKSELNILIQRGLAFDLERTIYKRKKGIFGYFRELEKVTETLRFKIQEPTLSTLDRIASEQIDLFMDEKLMSSETGMSEAKKLVEEHSERMAKIVAYAVLGQDYVKGIQEGSHIRYGYDDAKLEELTDLFFHNIKPSKLFQLVVLINTMSNLGDFCNSIRLMSAARTTMPLLVEGKKKD